MSTPTNKSVNIYINGAAAQKTLSDLQLRADKFTDAIHKGEKAGKDMSDSISKLGNTKAKIAELEQIISGKMAPSLTMVKNRANELRRELERMSTDAPGYAAKFKEFEQVNTTLRTMQTNVRNVGSAMKDAQSASSNFWKDAGKIALGTFIGNTVQAGMQAISGYISGIVSGNAKLSDSLADVQKATGLTAAEVAKLNSALGKIDTRTSTADLREIAIGLGQIGQAATPAAVAAIDKIVVALGDEFGGGAKEITTTLGILRNNLQDLQTSDYGADVLAIGNALNTLGAEGLATAPVVTDFATRMAGVAGTFKLTSGQILGLSATMQELGINVERGSTATIKILQKIAAEPAKFAAVAGQGVKEFTDLINNDMAAAFNAVAVGAGKASGKNTEFAKVLKDLDADGSGAGEVLSKLSKNQELLADKTQLASEALKGNSSILEEFNTKNNNLAANLEKLSKNISSWFSNSTLSSFLNDLIKELGTVTEKTQSATEAFDSQTQKVLNLEQKISPLLTRYDELATKANKSTSENTEMKSIIEQVTAVMPNAATQFDKYGNAIAISTGRVREFINAEKDRLKVVNAEAIKDNEKALRQEQLKLQTLKAQADQIAKTGGFQVRNTFVDSKDANPQYFRPATEKEIAAALAAYKNQISTVNGRKLEIERLNGDALQKAIDAQEKARKETPTPTATTTGGSTPSSPNEKNLQESQEREFEITKQHYTDMDAWLKQATSDWANALNAPYEAALAKYKQSIAQRKLEADQYYANGIIDEERHAEIKEKIANEDLKGRIALARTFAPQSAKAEKDLQDAITEETNKGVQDRKKRIKDSLDEIPRWVKDVIAALNVAADVSNVVGQAFDVIAQKEDNELKRDEQRNNAKKKNLDKQLADKQISQASYNRKVTKMDAEMEEKRKKAAIAQFNRDKLLAIANATINMATGIMKAVAASFATGGLPWSAIIASIGAAQIGVIASQAPPEFADGGVLPGKGGVPSGPRHANGGIALMDPSGQKRGEIEGGEPILSIDTYRNNRAVVDALLDASMNRGGASLGWLNNMGSSLNYSRAAETMNFNRMYGNGGIISSRTSSGGSSSSGSRANISDAEMVEAMRAFTAQLQNGVMAYTYYNDTDRKNNEIAKIKKISSANPLS
jgi:hypothetical protein